MLDLENLWENELSGSSALVGEQFAVLVTLVRMSLGRKFALARTITRVTHSWRTKESLFVAFYIFCVLVNVGVMSACGS